MFNRHLLIGQPQSVLLPLFAPLFPPPPFIPTNDPTPLIILSRIDSPSLITTLVNFFVFSSTVISNATGLDGVIGRTLAVLAEPLLLLPFNDFVVVFESFESFWI
ncbi:hypothetical protein DERP_003108 [Dermatophagoides pteronyssinus]|uniref:Uncharacterized protein n=1 Tax=Dermatophagoides pteronyssinus TaxID=6956 RepID=A0ABQ8JIW4_DERPT|nr:hypothetical protein DERP_003108 [Dermatophagoides pteronyssinus]